MVKQRERQQQQCVCVRERKQNDNNKCWDQTTMQSEYRSNYSVATALGGFCLGPGVLFL